MTQEEEALRRRLGELESENERLREEVRRRDEVILSLQEEIKELRRRTSMDSTNSSKPPSTDGYRKPRPRSLRERSGRRPGGQPGHAGRNIELPHEPDVVVDHIPVMCQGCPGLTGCIAGGRFSPGESRYVIEAVTATRVVEHRSVRAECPMGLREADDGAGGPVGQFPPNVKAHIQYGDSMVATAVLLDTYGAMSDARISDVIRSLFGVSLSPGTVVSMTSRCSDAVLPTMERVREAVIGSPVSNFDETGIRSCGRLVWVHNASTPELTYQTVSPRRGMEGILDCGVIRDSDGIAVHDCLPSYFLFDNVGHGICGAHLLRELNGIREMEPTHLWPGRFKDLLLFMKSAKEEAIGAGLGNLDPEILDTFDRMYDEILALADAECPPPPEPAVPRRGRRKKGRERSLIERLRRLKGAVCLHVRDFRVPFDNNQAERDLRNVKTKSKVSGCFRSERGARDYVRLSSYISTGRKQGVNPYEAMVAALEGRADALLHFE